MIVNLNNHTYVSALKKIKTLVNSATALSFYGVTGSWARVNPSAFGGKPKKKIFEELERKDKQASLTSELQYSTVLS